MNRIKTWKAQGSYRSFKTGKPMIMVLTDRGTVLEPLHPVKGSGTDYGSIMVKALNRKFPKKI